MAEGDIGRAGSPSTDTAHPPASDKTAAGPSRMETKPDPVMPSAHRHDAEHRQPRKQLRLPAQLQRCLLPQRSQLWPAPLLSLQTRVTDTWACFPGGGRWQKAGQGPGKGPSRCSSWVHLTENTPEMGMGARGNPLFVSALNWECFPFSFPAHIRKWRRGSWGARVGKRAGEPASHFHPQPLQPAQDLTTCRHTLGVCRPQRCSWPDGAPWWTAAANAL